MSDEEIKLDIQQQRIEKAVAKELENTATVIVKTGIFDNIDKLYGSSSGTTAGGAPPAGEETAPEPGGLGGLGAPPPGGEGAPPPGGEITPESRKDSNYNILLENDDMLMDDEIIDLSRAKNYLGEMENELSKLLND
jgi:hypothetical protein